MANADQYPNPQDTDADAADLEALEQLDPETRKLILSLGQAGTLKEILAQQFGQGAGMMQTPGAQGAHVGGTYTAAHPLEHLSVGLQRGLGGRMTKESLAKQGELADRDAAGRSAFMGLAEGSGDSLRRQRALAVMGLGSGDPALGAVGRHLAATADRREAATSTRAAALAKALEDAEKTQEQRAWQEGRDEKSRAAALERARILAGYVDARNQGERSRKNWIGQDFESVGDDREVSPSVLADAQKQIVDSRRVLSNIGRVDELLERNPNGVLVGDDAVKLQTLVEGIKLREKEIQGLGVLTGNDYEILSRIVADPTSIKEALKSGAGVRPLRTAFQALRDLTQNDAGQLADSLGFRAKPGSPFAPRGARSTGTVTVIWKGKRREIPADRLEEALGAGAEAVE